MRSLLVLVSVVVLVVSVSASDGWSAAATQPGAAPPVHVDLPVGWEPKAGDLQGALQAACNPRLPGWFELVAVPKSDYTDDVDLQAWARDMKENIRGLRRLKNHEETDLQERTIGGRHVMEYEISGELKSVRYRQRVVMLQVGDYFCRVSCWTVRSRWEAAQGDFETLIKDLK